MMRPWRLGTINTATAVVLLALLLFVTYLTYRDILEKRRNAEIENAVAIGRTIASEVGAFMEDIENTTLAIAVALGAQEAPYTQQSVGPYLKRVHASYELLRALFVTDLQGRVLAAASGEGIGTDLSSRSYVRALREGAQTVWSDSLVGIQTGQVTIAFGRIMQAPDGAVRGYLLAAFYPVRLVARLQASLPPDARLALIDRRGHVMHTTYEPGLAAAQRDLSGEPMVQEALSGRPVRISGQGLPFTQEPRFGALVPIARTGWVLHITRPLAPLEMQIRGSAVRQAGGIALVATLAAVIGLIIAHRMTIPVRRLAKTAEAIARGERPTVPAVRGPAEVVQLAAGMQAMTRAVAEREDALRLLAEASKELGRSLDYEMTLSNVARLAVPRIADWCVVDIVDEEGELRQLAVEHVDPEKVQLAQEVQRRYPPDPNAPTGPPNVVRTGRSELYAEIPDAMLVQAARDEEHLKLLRTLGLTSVMIVPLLGRERTLGAITLVTAESGRRFGPGDLEMAEELARRAALAIENARLYTRQRGIAETLQRSLLRKDLPEMPGVAAAARYLPAKSEAEVGGDWYDLFALTDGRVGMVMGDVAGRGIEAATVMGQLQHALRAYALEGHAPASVMERLNTLLELKDMATLIYLIFDPATWTLTYANAGHLPPLTIAPDGQVSMLEGGSPPLGGSPLTIYKETTAALAPGSTILLYTDGLIEVRGESLDVGLARLAKAAGGSGDEDIEALSDRILSIMVGSEGASDDIALLALRAEALDPARLLLRVPATPNALPLVRHTLRRWLAQSMVTQEDIYEISVATAEACANSIEHAYHAADAHLEIEAGLQDGVVSVTVRDWGRWREPRGTHRGRGLVLMRGLMDDVQVTPSAHGTTVQMRRRLKREIRA